MEKYAYLIVGAGFTGSVIAERIASQLSKIVLVIDKRDHIGGNCYDYCDENGILVQKYGPHIFHTNNKKVFDYLSQFTRWNNYRLKVIAFYQGEYYPIPINLNTVNKFYNLNLKNEEELKKFLDTKKRKIKEIKNSKDVITSKFGEELYEAFIKHFSKRQWDKFPEELDKSILERLPIRYNKNPYYFSDKFQGMPIFGFTKLFEKMLDNENIIVKLNTNFFLIKEKIKYKNLIYTGPIDEFFNYKFGRLQYRCVNFFFETLNQKDFQPNSVINYTDKDVEFSRVTEFKKFYNKKNDKTVICKDKFIWKGEPSYPVVTEKNLRLLKKYKKEAKKLKNVVFLGRLGQYKYLNMDEVVERALKVFDRIKKC